MPGNTEPIFSRVGDLSNNSSTAFSSTMVGGTGDHDGTSVNYQLLFTADSTNGSWVDRIRLRPIGNNSAGTLRIFLNNGSAQTTASNNAYWDEIALPATTSSTTTPMQTIDVPMNIALNPGFRIYGGVSATMTSGWEGTVIGGKY